LNSRIRTGSDEVTEANLTRFAFFIMYHVYILFSAGLNKCYIGFTAGTVELRLIKHLSSNKGFTSKARDWKIVYTERFPIKNMAMLRGK
jgi:putative endonuclease